MIVDLVRKYFPDDYQSSTHNQLLCFPIGNWSSVMSPVLYTKVGYAYQKFQTSILKNFVEQLEILLLRTISANFVLGESKYNPKSLLRGVRFEKHQS